jgi:hypothetical protein
MINKKIMTRHAFGLANVSKQRTEETISTWER